MLFCRVENLIVVGGGITGLLTAYLAPGSTVIEREPEVLNSRASLYLVMPPLCGDLAQVCLSSGEELEKVAEKLGVDHSRRHIVRVDPKPLGGKIVEGKELRELEPLLKAERAEVFDNGVWVDGDSLIESLYREVKPLKGEAKVVMNRGRVEGVEVNGTLMKAEAYVFATGYLTDRVLGRRFNKLKGHLLVARPVGLRNVVILNGKIAVEGRFLLLDGDAVPSEDRGVDTNSVGAVIETFRQGLGREIEVLEVRAGLRTVSETGRPVVEKVAENAVLITGYRFGFALAPYMAREGLRLLGYFK